MTIAQHSDTSCFCSSVGLPRGGVVGFKDVSSRRGAEVLTQLSVFMKLLLKKRQLRNFSLLCLQC